MDRAPSALRATRRGPAKGSSAVFVRLCFAKSLPDPKNPCQRYKPVVALLQITFVEEVKNPVDETPAIAAAEAVDNPKFNVFARFWVLLHQIDVFIVFRTLFYFRETLTNVVFVSSLQFG